MQYDNNNQGKHELLTAKTPVFQFNLTSLFQRI